MIGEHTSTAPIQLARPAMLSRLWYSGWPVFLAGLIGLMALPLAGDPALRQPGSGLATRLAQPRTSALHARYMQSPATFALPGVAPDLTEAFATIEANAGTDQIYARARDALHNGQPAAAFAPLKEIAEATAGSGDKAREEAAAAFRRLGLITLLVSPPHAQPAFARAGELQPDSPDTDFWLAWTSLLAGKPDAAKAAYDRVLTATAPQQPTAYTIWSRIGLADIAKAQAELGPALSGYRRASAEAQVLTTAAPKDIGLARLAAAAKARLGNAQLAHGNVTGALEALTASRDAATGLAGSHPGNEAVRRDLALAHADLANALMTGGQLPVALQALRASLEAFKGLAAAQPNDPARQRDVAVSLVNLGDAQRTGGHLDAALASFTAAHEITVGLASAAGHSNGPSSWQSDLAISYQRLGDIEMARGNPAEALKHYQAIGNVADTLARAAPEDAGHHRLQFLAHVKVGDARIALRDLAGALESFTAADRIAGQLAERDPGNAGWQRDMAFARAKLGDALNMLGRGPDAVRAYHAAYQTTKQLGEADPANMELQRDQSVLASKAGNILLAMGNPTLALRLLGSSLAIRERLAAAAPTNAVWQRDLAIAYGRMGDALLAAKQPGEAAPLFANSFRIVEQLARADAGNAMLMVDLALAHERRATLARASGDGASALQSYERSATIYAALLKANPDNTSLLVGSTVPMIWIGEIDPTRRQPNFERALAILKALDAKGQLEAGRRGNIAYLEHKLGSR